jgi:cytosine deaminase
LGFDLLIRDARLPEAGRGGPTVDIGVSGGRFAAVAPRLAEGAAEVVEAGGRLVSPGFVETHIHLDKTCVIDRCACEEGRAHRAMERVSAVKHTFTVEDVADRGARTLERCITHGTTLMRTHAEVDPKVGLRGFEGVRSLAKRYAWAVDIEICVMPQEGLTNNPGTGELMVAALESGATVVGAAPSYDTDPAAQIRRVFELARRHDLDIDMHLDSGNTAEHLDLLLVCDLAEEHGWEGRVAIGHATKLSVMPPGRLEEVAARLRNAGVAVTVLPSTDLYLGGRDQEWGVRRNVADANALKRLGVTCSISSNNILNPFTPMGDGQLIRQANLYANTVQRASLGELEDIWAMFTADSARLMRRPDHGIAPGNPADFVLVDAPSAVDALREIAPTLGAWKKGRRSYTRGAPVLHRP